jgi:long-chain acyl-CoA synthetase
LVDRKGDMIISGGFNIYPKEIENVLYEHPAVLEAAVFGVPDDEWGESVRAVVTLKPNMSATEEELIDHCRKQVAGYKKPKKIDFIAEMPKSFAGKILKRELKAPFWKGRTRMVS